MKQINSIILQNNKVAEGFYRMRIESPYLAKNIKPGQFIEVLCSRSKEPLLRRPLGCHRIFDKGIEVLYEIVGQGTELLSRKVAGEYLDVIGPLGNGFDINPKSYTLNPILIAGGIGVAPLMALAQRLVDANKKVHVLIGACSKSHILCEKEFKKLGAKVLTATEDGSKGRKGLVTELLEELLARDGGRAIMYACGPNAMLKTITHIAQEEKIPCQVSLEERMACGVGICLGCPVKVKIGGRIRTEKYEYKMVCKDGPVFDAEEIVWPEAL